MPIQNMDRHLTHKKHALSSESTNNTYNSKSKKTARILQLVQLNGNSILANINGKLVSCLVDSGASVSCCSLNLIDNLGIHTKKFKKPIFTEAVGVGGEIHHMLGIVTLPITIGNVAIKQNFHVLDKMQQKMILGHDFLKHHKIHLDFDQETLYIPDEETKTYSTLEMNSGLARTIHSVTIPPLSQGDIPVKVSRVQGEVAIMEPLSTLPEQSLAGAKCCISLLSGNKSCIRIMNPTKKGVTLAANSIVASVSTVQSDSILPLNDKGNNSKSTDKDSVASDNFENDTLDFNLDNSDLIEHQKSLFTLFLDKNRQVFAKDLSELCPTNVYQHVIDSPHMCLKK